MVGAHWILAVNWYLSQGGNCWGAQLLVGLLSPVST